jgi:hypothetical protein
MYSKPKVKIDLAEYEELLGIKRSQAADSRKLGTVKQGDSLELWFLGQKGSIKLGELDIATIGEKDLDKYEFFIRRLDNKLWE